MRKSRTGAGWGASPGPARHRVDIRGKICPYTVIETRDALGPLKAGQVLEVITDYRPAAMQTIPSMCEKKGYAFEIVEDRPEGGDGTGLWRVLITKGD